jgi:hypothetical protein
MQKTINIKDTHVTELVDVFGEKYQTEILDVDGETLIPNPQTKSQFANEQFDSDIKVYIKRRVQMYRQRLSLQSVDNTEITE